MHKTIRKKSLRTSVRGSPCCDCLGCAMMTPLLTVLCPLLPGRPVYLAYFCLPDPPASASPWSTAYAHCLIVPRADEASASVVTCRTSRIRPANSLLLFISLLFDCFEGNLRGVRRSLGCRKRRSHGLVGRGCLVSTARIYRCCSARRRTFRSLLTVNRSLNYWDCSGTISRFFRAGKT